MYYHLEVSHCNCWCCLKYALKKISPASLEQHESVNFMWSCIMSWCSDDACYLQFRILPLSLLSQIIHAIICPLAATPSARLLFFWKYFTRSGRKRRGKSYYHDIASLRKWENCLKRNMWVILFIILSKYTSSEK